jgi:hypothetical protein
MLNTTATAGAVVLVYHDLPLDGFPWRGSRTKLLGTTLDTARKPDCTES